jgi:hypothetical protein
MQPHWQVGTQQFAPLPQIMLLQIMIFTSIYANEPKRLIPEYAQGRREVRFCELYKPLSDAGNPKKSVCARGSSLTAADARAAA